MDSQVLTHKPDSYPRTILKTMEPADAANTSAFLFTYFCVGSVRRFSFPSDPHKLRTWVVECLNWCLSAVQSRTAAVTARKGIRNEAQYSLVYSLFSECCQSSFFRALLCLNCLLVVGGLTALREDWKVCTHGLKHFMYVVAKSDSLWSFGSVDFLAWDSAARPVKPVFRKTAGKVYATDFVHLPAWHLNWKYSPPAWHLYLKYSLPAWPLNWKYSLPAWHLNWKYSLPAWYLNCKYSLQAWHLNWK